MKASALMNAVASTRTKKTLCAACGTLVPLLIAGCAHLAVEGGDKPIKVDMTVTFKVDQQLEQFYAFQHRYDAPTTNPATQPAGQPATQPSAHAG
jgi:hypothetical protein